MPGTLSRISIPEITLTGYLIHMISKTLESSPGSRLSVSMYSSLGGHLRFTGEHLSDSSQRHNIVPYKHRTTSVPNYPKCPNHSRIYCELYCEKCDIPVCSTCISSGKRKGHDLLEVLQKLSLKRKDLEKDLKKFVNGIYPAYEEIASDIKSEKHNLEIHYKKLRTAVSKQGEDWHREIKIIVHKQKPEIDEMKAKHLAVINKQENEIKRKISELRRNILNMIKILHSNDVSLTSTNKSKNAEFRSLSPKLNFFITKFLSS
ncbi:E3 ubiquitin-protein ligase TRIM45-like [Saccostrea echinata]|uniref:E3 ubiquitin-protein ligase TRIM45-like n=1 Tax=Saccostrea echinata TaxID=191078 RepID=UPI002A7EDAAF|nr:E3 ubiquitin-protein ligase TRIM45-like [Saccostrea echinata]